MLQKPELSEAAMGYLAHTDTSPSKRHQYLPRFAIEAFSMVPQQIVIQNERESTMICHNKMANEPQRSAGMKYDCNMSQGKPCQISWATPLVLYCTVSSLTLPKLHLASLNRLHFYTFNLDE